MTPRQVIEHYGTQEATASALGITQGAVSLWVVAGSVPMLRQYQIQVQTNGALRADPLQPAAASA